MLSCTVSLHVLSLANAEAGLTAHEHVCCGVQGRLTLLLGPPGSGKSTLLKALSNKLDRGLKLQGDVTYNGHRWVLPTWHESWTLPTL